MFRMIGFGENLGSGFPLILSAWNEKHWLEPELIEQKDLKQVKLVLHFRSENVVKDVVKQLTVRQQLLLEMIRQDNTISARAMSESLSGKEKVAERTVQRDLGILKKLGILSRTGGRSNGEWVINEDYR